MELLMSQPVVGATSTQLNYDIDPTQVDIQQIPDTQVILVTVENQDPQLASNIANTLVGVLIDQNENLQAGRYASMEENLKLQIDQVELQIESLQTQFNQIYEKELQDQLTEVDSQISSLQEEIFTLQEEIVGLTPAEKEEEQALIAEKQSRLSQTQSILMLYQEIRTNLIFLGTPNERGVGREDPYLIQLQSTLDLYQEIYLSLLNNLETIRLSRLHNTPFVVQIEEATVPQEPFRPIPLLYTLLAGVVGVILTGGVIFLIDYLDDTLMTREDIQRVLGLPVIGYIVEMNSDNNLSRGVLVTDRPRSPETEAFRSMRANIEFASQSELIKTLLVVSVNPGEGKTTVAVNLAVSFAQSGKKVLLIDADLRHSNIHSYLAIENKKGLSNIFSDDLEIKHAMKNYNNVEGLTVITSGSIPPGPTEILSSSKMDQILKTLKKQVDLVIIDSPPLFISDALILSSIVDGILLVVQPGQSNADAARVSLEQLNRAGAKIVGVALNRIPYSQSLYYYEAYQYWTTNNDNDDDNESG
jgi:capsular exopolysaccharide synthesis family protein